MVSFLARIKRLGRSDDRRTKLGNGAKSHGLIDAYCKRIALPGIGDQQASWEALIEALNAAALKYYDSEYNERNSGQRMPFSDVIIKDPETQDHYLAKQLKPVLDGEFADTQTLLSCLSTRDQSLNSRVAYIGHGVFAPVSGQDIQTDDLEFSLTPPDAEGIVKPSDIVRLELFENSVERPAGWYMGQRGLAISFSTPLAPARIYLTSDYCTQEQKKAFEQTLLFIGREARYSKPSVYLFDASGLVDPSSTGRTCQATLMGEALLGEARNLAWQEILLEAGDQKLSLWVRFLPKCGVSGFTPYKEDVAEIDHFAIKGFVLPEIGFWPKPGRISRWFVHYTRKGFLRYAEIQDVAVSAIHESLGRRASLFHDSGRGREWQSGASSPGSHAEMVTGGELKLILEPFPPKKKSRSGFIRRGEAAGEGAKIRNALGRLYRSGKHKWTLATQEGVTAPDLGYIPAFSGNISGKPARRQMPKDINSDIVGIDWLNRMVQLEVDGQLVGLADYWSRHYTANLRKTAEGFECTHALKGTAAKSIMLRCKPGNRTMLGPLYVEYRPASSRPAPAQDE